MKRILLTFIIGFTTFLVHAQSDYYKSLDSNKRCQDLKDALFTLINTGYNTRDYNDAWILLETYDTVRINNKLYVYDIFTFKPDLSHTILYQSGDKCIGGTSATKEGICWNREHIFPASWFGQESFAYGDIVNLIPTDGFVNNKKSNNPMGKVASATYTSSNGTKLGTSGIANITGNMFEPIDEFKGDIARVLLYFTVKYQDKFFTWNNTEFNRVKGTDKLMGYKKEYLDMLIQWHLNDPVSKKELDRNERIFVHQRNRNPFVDHPEFVEYIWRTSDCKAVGVPYHQVAENILYPNPANQVLNLSHTAYKGQKYYISDISGRRVQEGIIENAQLDVKKLNIGTYFLFIEEEQQVTFSKFMIAR